MEANASPEHISHIADDSQHAHMISVQIDPEFSAALDAERLHELACHTLESEGQTEPVQLGITITSDREIHALNVQYLGHDYPTDVLSFGSEGVPAAGGRQPLPAPATEDNADEAEYEDEEDQAAAAQFTFVTPPGMPRYLGDVVISYETAAAQGPDYGLSAAQEVDFLLVHGVLHLLGYDDATPEQRADMHRRQEELISGFSARL